MEIIEHYLISNNFRYKLRAFFSRANRHLRQQRLQPVAKPVNPEQHQPEHSAGRLEKVLHRQIEENTQLRQELARIQTIIDRLSQISVVGSYIKKAFFSDD